ncbi:MAG: hypothetical protein WAK13_20375, partial [Terriglobales bacterium]
RYFIDKLATRVFEIGEGKVELYPGNYEDYLWRKQGGAAKQTAAMENELVGELSAIRALANHRSMNQRSTNHRSTEQASTEQASVHRTADDHKSVAAPSNGDSPKTEAPDSKAKRVNPIKRKQMQDRLHEIEEEITRTEAAIALYETQLQTFISAEEMQRQTQELEARKADLQGLMKEWEELSGVLS